MKPGWIMTLIVAAAAVLRLYDLPQAALSHFDEGVYATTARELMTSGALYPMQELYSPLGYPALAALAGLALGPSAVTAVGVSALAGVLTCLMLGWVGRWLFSAGVGLAAAGLLAVNDLHIAFSKAALTDATFTLWFVTALGLLYTAWGSGGIGQALLAGLAVGLAWNTKYHGFLALVIALVAIGLDAVRARAVGAWPIVRKQLPRTLSLWLVSVVTAAACYVPWILIVERRGGYGRLLQHQAGYLQAWPQWLEHAQALLADMAVFRHVGTLGAIAGLLAIAAAAFSRAGGRRAWLAAWAVTAVAVAVFAGVEAVYLAAAVVGIVRAVTRGSRADQFAAAWVLVLLSIIPLYHPYVRLALPLVPGMMLLGVRWIWQALGEAPVAGRLAVRVELAGGLVLTLLAGASGGRLFDVPLGRWQASFAARGGYGQAGDLIDRLTEPLAVVVCHGQPPLLYYCPRPAIPTTDQDLVAVAEAAGAATDRPVYLAVDFIIGRHAEAAASIRRHQDRLEMIGETANELGLLALVDEFGGEGFWSYLREFDAPRFQAMRTIRLYRVPPKPGVRDGR